MRVKVEVQGNFGIVRERVFGVDENSAHADIACQQQILAARSVTTNLRDQPRPTVLALFNFRSDIFAPFLAHRTNLSSAIYSLASTG